MKPMTIISFLSLVCCALYSFLVYSLTSVGLLVIIFSVILYPLFLFLFASLVLIKRKKNTQSICLLTMSLSGLIFITSLFVIFYYGKFNPMITFIITITSFFSMFTSAVLGKILEKK